jgi:RNA polymerase sigma-70 factor, ECF subfamily
VRADQWLWEAAQSRQPGPFQLEAAVQSAHCHRLFTGQTPWQAIATLYQQINRSYPTLGSLVAGAVAAAEAGDIEAGLKQLGSIDKKAVQSFQPWWVARAYLLSKQGPEFSAPADSAYLTAIGLTTQQRLKDHLQKVRGSVLT